MRIVGTSWRLGHRWRIASVHWQRMEVVILVGETAAGSAAGRVVEVLRQAGRTEETVRRHRAVLERFAAFLVARDLVTAGDEACLDFIASQTGVRLGGLREHVQDRSVGLIRRPVVLMADALAGRTLEVDQSVIPAKEGCPAGFRLLRDDYLASCRRRGNAVATLVATDKAVSRFLAYLEELGVDDLGRSASGSCPASSCATATCGARASRS